MRRLAAAVSAGHERARHGGLPGARLTDERDDSLAIRDAELEVDQRPAMAGREEQESGVRRELERAAHRNP